MKVTLERHPLQINSAHFLLHITPSHHVEWAGSRDRLLTGCEVIAGGRSDSPVNLMNMEKTHTHIKQANAAQKHNFWMPVEPKSE